METEHDLSKTSVQHKEFQALLEKDFAKRNVKEGKIIKATVTEITPKFIVCDALLKADQSEIGFFELWQINVSLEL